MGCAFEFRARPLYMLFTGTTMEGKQRRRFERIAGVEVDPWSVQTGSSWVAPSSSVTPSFQAHGKLRGRWIRNLFLTNSDGKCY